MIEIFEFEDYVSFIKARVRTAPNNWGLWTKLSKAANCQPTYLTQVMKGKAHLSSDQLLGIADFFHLSESQTDYFFLLLEFAKSGTKNLKARLRKKIEKAQKDHQDLANRMQQPRLDIGEKETLYYSAWYWAALHIATSIPQYQSAEALSQRLFLPPHFVLEALERMSKFNIVKKVGSKWVFGDSEIHIPNHSVMIGMHHNNWRQRAVTDSTLNSEDSLHFTGVYSLSLSDWRKLRQQLLRFIEDSRTLIRESQEEELICFNCDLFKA